MTTWQRRLLVVEDESLVASLLCEVLGSAGFEAQSCPNASAARTMVDAFDPDGALIDINLGPGPNGLQLGHLLHRTHPHIGLVFLTRYHDPRVASADGLTVPEGSAFLAKERMNDTARLTAAIESVLGASAPPMRDDAQPGGSLSVLTATQLEILRLVALGLTNRAIAQRRGTNERTVEQRLQSTYHALGIVIDPNINPRVEAIRRYIVEAGVPTEVDSLAAP